MTNLLPGFALWWAGRKKLGIFLGSLTVLLYLVTVFNVVSGFYSGQVEIIKRSGSDSLFPELQQISIWYQLADLRFTLLSPAIFGWLLWGTSLWLASGSVRVNLHNYGRMLLVGLISPGFLEKTDGSMDVAKKVRTTFLFWVGFFAGVSCLPYLGFLQALGIPYPFSRGFLPRDIILFCWPVIVIGIALHVGRNARKMAAKYSAWQHD